MPSLQAIGSSLSLPYWTDLSKGVKTAHLRKKAAPSPMSDSFSRSLSLLEDEPPLSDFSGVLFDYSF